MHDVVGEREMHPQDGRGDEADDADQEKADTEDRCNTIGHALLLFSDGGMLALFDPAAA
jgi:hypothetical protein